MPITTKKSSTKKPSKASIAASKSHAATHPSWECIIAHPEDVRGGVSRPTIKKFVESKYHIYLNATAASQLNRAITSGSEKGIFVLPKGPSGKIKLAPKVRVDAYKENTKPAVKKGTATAKITTKAKINTGKRPTSLKKAPPTIIKKSNTSVITKKSPTKKVSAMKKTTTAKKPVAAKKTITAKKSSAKKVITGDVKRPKTKTLSSSGKARSATTPSKAKPAFKAKPASKVKPASKSAPAPAAAG
ncbi:hypothetical protein BDQ17DRAFT_1426298 [Cyathus striatus]|nr:hypothetical protein BDQ17DRAFT_1426298 [Cyathus striatus]